MNLRVLIALVFAATALLWGGWAWTLWTVDPEATNWIGFVLFYLIFFLAFIGTASLLGIIIRHKRQPSALVYNIVAVAFRQGFLLSLFVTVLIWLQAQRLVGPLTVGLGFVVVVLMEAYWARRDARQHKHFSQAKRGESPSFPPAASGPSPVFTKKDLI